MSEKILLILAAGLGTRFKGGVKQLTPVGPNGELIIEYSAADALKAGCTKAVFIIRRSIEDEIRTLIGSRLEKLVKVEYCYQESDRLPIDVGNISRSKPWGTAHAVLSAKDKLDGPFVIINSDDYYGSGIFEKLFGAVSAENGKEIYLGGFRLENTLSGAGTVTRGICEVGDGGKLLSVTETYSLGRNGSGEIWGERDGKSLRFDGKSIVSMNVWGCTPEILSPLEKRFAGFLEKASREGALETAEYALPTAFDSIIKEDGFSARVIPSCDKWLGITRAEDCEQVRREFAEMERRGMYSSPVLGTQERKTK